LPGKIFIDLARHVVGSVVDIGEADRADQVDQFSEALVQVGAAVVLG
jgi:hypothetical protein